MHCFSSCIAKLVTECFGLLQFYIACEGRKMIQSLLFISLLIHATLAQRSAKDPSQLWQTLTGDPPLVIARGGLSGVFPESSQFANEAAISNGMPNTVLYCDLQLSKDEVGFCVSDLRLDNSTNIASVYPKSSKSYNINGEEVRGWFVVDFTADQLFNNVTMLQSTFTRTNLFDGNYPLSSVDDAMGMNPYEFWLNVQNNDFYTKRKLSTSAYIQMAQRSLGIINYISSPDIGFLKNMSSKVNRAKTKLIFRFGNAEAVETTTGEKYGSFLKDLGSIKLFASGILVPKIYIWPVGKDLYLQPATSLVIDAHREGLEVYAIGFANDLPGSYNYSYDPLREYIQFIDNSEFSVDGVVTDFAPTASSAIACMAHSNTTRFDKGKIVIISRNGSSATYPGSTDLSYEQAIKDGADVVDCSIQITKDGIPFCFGSIDLMVGTTAIYTFISRSTKIPQIQPNNGIFTFDLTWAEIQTLKPEILNPYFDVGMLRNPANKNKGNFVTLQSFLGFSKNASLLINIENAAFLATKGFDVTTLVANALSKGSIPSEKVFIKSDDSSVLERFKSGYKRVLSIQNRIGDAPKPAAEEIKKFAEGVSISRGSVVKTNGYSFTTGETNVVDELHAANLSVYVHGFLNEFTGIPIDFYSDPTVELATFISGIKIDGVETEFPATAVAYLRSRCFDVKSKASYLLQAIKPGTLIALIPKNEMSSSEPPYPSLQVSDVVDPPLPVVLNETSAPTESPTSSGKRHAVKLGFIVSLSTILLSLYG